MENITFSNVEFENFSQIDSNLVKLFQISQLIIEFLAHSQEFLLRENQDLNQFLGQIESELNEKHVEYQELVRSISVVYVVCAISVVYVVCAISVVYFVCAIYASLISTLVSVYPVTSYHTDKNRKMNLN